MICYGMTTVGDRIRKLRKEGKLSQIKLAEDLNVSRQLVSVWEVGSSQPTSYDIGRIATYFGVTVDYLLGRTGDREGPICAETQSEYAALMQGVEVFEPGPRISLPVYEEAAAGAPCFVDERPIEYKSVDAARVVHDLPNYILVQVAGSSMINDGIMPGSMVLVHRQSTVEDRQIAVVRVKNDGVTIKRVRHLDGRYLLIPSNPSLREEIYNEEEVTICGRVVQAITDFE